MNQRELIKDKIRLVSKNVPGISFFYVVDGKKVIGHIGYSDLERKIKLNDKSVWEFRSISKHISATSVAWMVSQKLTTFKTKIYPSIPYPFSSDLVTKQATIRNGLSHTTGLSEDAGNQMSFYYYPLNKILKTLPYMPLNGFNQEIHYTNFGFTLGYVAAVSSSGFGDTVTDALNQLRKFCDRIGMNNVLLTTQELKESNHLVQPYLTKNNKFIKGNNGFIKGNNEFIKGDIEYVSAFVPAGGVNGTIIDLLRFIEFQLSNDQKLIKPRILNKIRKPVLPYHSLSGGELFYGMGTVIYNLNINNQEIIIYGHAGAYSEGFSTQILYNPDSGIGVGVMINSFQAYASALAAYIYLVLLGYEKEAEIVYDNVFNLGNLAVQGFVCNENVADVMINTKFCEKELDGNYFNQLDGTIMIRYGRIKVGKTDWVEIYFDESQTWFNLELTIKTNRTAINPIILNNKIIGLTLITGCYNSQYIKV